MSTIAQKLRQIAAARQLGLEADTDPAVQGEDGDLNQEELKKVADKAAETLPESESTEEGTTDTPTDAETAAEAPAAEEGAPTEDASLGEADPTADTGAPTEEPAADAEPTAEEIETPAEGELQELAESGDEGAEAVAEAGTDQIEGSDDAADESLNAVDETASEDGAGEASDPLADTGDAPSADAGDGLGDLESGIGADAGGTELGEAGAGDVAADPTAGTDEVPSAEAPAADAGAEDAAADPAAVTDETSAPTDATPATEEPAAEEQKPVETSVADASEGEAVNQVANLIEAVTDARSAEEVVKQARSVSDELFDVAETAEVINDQGGVSVESMALLQHVLRGPSSILERDIGVGVGMEAFAGMPSTHRVQIGLEEIADAIRDLEEAQPELERAAVEVLDRIGDALKDAIPTARDRLQSIISRASMSEVAAGQVEIDQGLSQALSIDGQFPEDIGDALQAYIETGKRILGSYSESAYRGIRAASLINNCIDFSSPAAFWEKLGKQVDDVCDPRTTLSESMLFTSLPGGARLFDNTTTEFASAPNEVLKKIVEFNNNYRPLEVAVGAGAVQAAGMRPGMSSGKIAMIGNSLLELSCPEAIACIMKQGSDLWPEAQDAIRFLRETFRYAPEEIGMETSAHFQQIVKLVETSYSLGTWPLVQYLSNLVVTINAFVLLAERCLAPREEVVETAVVDETAVVEDPAAAVEEPIAEEAAAEDAAEVTDEAPAGEEDLEDLSLESLNERLAAVNKESTRLMAAVMKRNQK